MVCAVPVNTGNPHQFLKPILEDSDYASRIALFATLRYVICTKARGSAGGDFNDPVDDLWR
jgi:hypothetical protein